MSRALSSSAMLMSVAVTMLGAVMLKLSGHSQLSLLLSLLVLTMGLGAIVVLMLRSNRATAAPRTASDSIHAHERLSSQSVIRRCDMAPQASPEAGPQLRMLTQLVDSFDAWLNSRQDQAGEGGWPALDRWLRDTLHGLSGARRLRCFHVKAGDRRLFSMADNLDEPAALGTAWRSLVDHVIDSGHMFVRSAGASSELVQRLVPPDPASPTGQRDEPPRWLLPVRIAGRTRGLIVVGEFDSPDWHDEAMLRLAGRIIEMCWGRVHQESELRVALQTDQVSGVLNRADLAEMAEQVLRAATDEGEPAVLMVLGIEGLRRLDDKRHWELHNWLMQQVGRTLRRRLRSDDIVGRFSDDRFVAVMRRLDMGLGELIARKALIAIADLLKQGEPVLASSVYVRCGIAGDSRSGFEELLGRASDALQQARADQVDLAACAATKSAVALEAGAAT